MSLIPQISYNSCPGSWEHHDHISSAKILSHLWFLPLPYYSHQSRLWALLVPPPKFHTFTLIQIPMVSLRFMCMSQSGFNSPVSLLTRKSFVFFQRAMPFQALTFLNIYSSFYNALHFLLYMVNTSTFKTTLKAHILWEAFSGSRRKFFNLSHIFPHNHPKIRLTTPNEKY